MLSREGPEGVDVLATVSTNADTGGIAVVAGVGISRVRVALTAYAAAPATTTAATNHDTRNRRTWGEDGLVRL